ncbi:uncharacterized protein MELLADRAFT_67382 [Melampsora larici-populina 98AG31]|uniref:Uncharacterized protein n=1 Tax=Melampsora larici-populina (strain 98AG31 / pathotype 3-4-7) TaxID=747676 RepID=F4S2Y8_MELLP|nr:uncharacterized protein MELLADRAFT_67382 [Melampsora larici-populina 98AG31]EGG00996.1 hypothetical protein MELLADRAFT_67382 [Melampsora larici-populina 98AG31]
MSTDCTSTNTSGTPDSEGAQAYMQDLDSIDQIVRTWLQHPMSISLYSCLTAVLSEVAIEIKEIKRRLVDQQGPSALASKKTFTASKNKTLRRSLRFPNNGLASSSNTRTLSRSRVSTLKASCIAKRKKSQNQSRGTKNLKSSKFSDRPEPTTPPAVKNNIQHTFADPDVEDSALPVLLDADSVDGAALTAFENSLSQDLCFDLPSDGVCDDPPSIAIIPAEVKKIHSAALALLQALVRGSPVSFDPEEVLPQAVTFDSRQDHGIRMWCQRTDNRRLFYASEQTSWYKPDIFDFDIIDQNESPKDIPIHERYLWDTFRMFHNPTPTFVERGMHYVMAAVVLVGMDCNNRLILEQSPSTISNPPLAQTSLNAISCWHHYKRLAYIREKTIQDNQSNLSSGCIKDLDRLIASIYSLVVAFASIWASVTLDADIEACNNLISTAISQDMVSRLTVQKGELLKARNEVDIEHSNLQPLVSFLCSGVTGLMIYPKDKNVFSTLRAVNFLLVTSELMKLNHSFSDPVWRRTQSYIVQFLKDLVLSAGQWEPRELNRYHLAKALFLDFAGFWLAQNISKIPIPKSRNYKITDKEYL